MRWPISWLQFSLSKLFALVTLCAIGTWYWYQRPYPVEKWVESLWGVCLSGRRATDPPPPKNYREVRYYRRVRGRHPVQDGPYYGYDSKGTLLRSGYYRDGWPDGEFAEYGPKGGKTIWNEIHGLREGEERSWNHHGQLLAFTGYHHGKRHGPSREWNSSGKLLREENYDADIPHGLYFICDQQDFRIVTGWFDHGVPTGSWKWVLHDTDIEQIVGEWHEGQPVGRWEWTDRDGKLKLVVEFKAGRVIHIDPIGISPRVIEHIVRKASQNPDGSANLFTRPASPVPRELSMEDLVGRACFGNLGVAPDLDGLKLAKLDATSPVVVPPNGTTWLLTLRDVLARHGLGYDLRYGKLCIDTFDGIAAWQDPTGVTGIIPPAHTRLFEQWSQPTYIDFVETPLGDVLQFLADLHMTQFDTSGLSDTGAAEEGRVTLETPITTQVQGLSFRDGLGVLLEQVELQASLRKSTIVISPRH